MTKTIISVDSFIGATKLPSGYRFKEWTPGNLVAACPAMGGVTYIDSVMAAIERTTDGAYVCFEISYLQGMEGTERGLIYMGVAELAQAVDQAIEKLAA